MERNERNKQHTCLGEERVVISEVENLVVVVSRLANVKHRLDIWIDKPMEMR